MVNWTGKRIPAPERFWLKVEKTETCWLWRNPSHEFGYGFFWVNGKGVNAHRYSWELHYGPVPDGLCVLHRCDVPSCVKPTCLFLGTKGQNNADRANKRRSASGDRSGPRLHRDRMPRGEQHHMARLTDVQVREIRRRYKPFTVTRKMLAHEYGVSRSLVNQILNGHIWTHLL